jgi:hypothetical protein
MPQVTIVGAGIAGLSAALRLVERGFDVTVLEQDAFLGGKLGAHTHAGRYSADHHEHSYHMYLNWYRNFWQIISEIGIFDHFRPETAICHLRPGKKRNPAKFYNVGSALSFWSNIFSGVAPPLDMLLYAYSLFDLLGTPLPHPHRSDTRTVLGFIGSRPYATKRSIALHSEALVKAFAIPSYRASLTSYRNFISYGFRHPSPMMWLLNGNTEQFLFTPLRRYLEKAVQHNRAGGGGARLSIRTLSRVDKIRLSDGKVTGLEVASLSESPTIALAGKSAGKVATHLVPISGDVIFAIPPNALAQLVDFDVLQLAPQLGNVIKLRSEPMAALNLYFKRRIPNVPKEITILMDSEYDLSFLDNSQRSAHASPNDVTFLNVVASDFSALGQCTGTNEYDRTKEILYQELAHYLDFKYDPITKMDDIDRDRSHLQTNVGEGLFTNDVGTWEFRPDPTSAISNLFIAGDYCKTFVDVVTIEGAVASGLIAAETVRKKAGVGSPIPILVPETYPNEALATLKLVGAPYAYMIKALSVINDVARSGLQDVFPGPR